ncbi:hypothetical protein [Lysobacter silvisoli]|uniref:DUF2189 domain-containing protein n=1 Tax=Lysobacter silvisoli TaxID=2293254 RepID=A0A371JXS8_9GAMM|nr:hypothetical protein [Lysobacter silvisoli]RDZ26463.1 hypothetical protein DX914_15820 [Lysobacter silvisoli]
MTQLRKVPLAQGVQWFVQAINIGARNPRAVFGAALLFIITLYALAVLFMLPVAASMGEGAAPDPKQLFPVVAALFLMLVFVFPILLGGLMHVIREAEAGRPVRARDLFAPLRTRKAGPLALLGAIQIALAAIGVALVAVLAGDDYWSNHMTAMRNAMNGAVPVMPEPQHPLLMMLVQLLFNYFSYALLLFCVPLILFSHLGVGDSLKAALRASVSNIAANLLASGLFVAGMLAGTLVVALVGLLVGVIGALIHPALGAILSLLVYAAFGSAVLVVLVGGSYLAWRDTFGDEAAPTPPPSSNTHIEA